MKIGVYTIALNEEKFAQRWADTVKDADYALVADTGSTDATVAILRSNNIEVQTISVKPFRFDDARNASLALLPADVDIAIGLDMDELLAPNWRHNLEQVWTPTTTRLRYQYVWSWTADQQPDLTFYSDKIAGRATHRWKHPVHEVLSATVPEVFAVCDPVLIEHHPDSSKSRGQYLDLLKLSVTEDPSDDRNAHYFGREYFFHGRWRDAITELHRHLSLPRAVWTAERAASMRYIAKCHEQLQEPKLANEWYLRATLEDPNSREALIDAARFALTQGAFHATIALCEQAIKSTTVIGEYMAERYARNEGAADLMSVAYWNIGQRDLALAHAKQAVLLNPVDPRLAENLRMMQGA